MCGFLSFILFAYKIALLLQGQIPPAQLVFTDPGNCLISVREFLLMRRKGDFRVLLNDPVSVMTVYNYVVPDDQGTKNSSFGQDISFKLFIFFRCQRRDLLGKLRIDPQFIYRVHWCMSLLSNIRSFKKDLCKRTAEAGA